MMMKNLFMFVLLLGLNSVAFSQHGVDTTHLETFKLGEITVTDVAKKGGQVNIGSRKIKKLQLFDIPQAVGQLPGISVSLSGGRNEALIYIRGFDLRRVPVFVDGVPVYVPYDGYIDPGRFLMDGVSKISIDKGFASMLYGANAMGGAINIVSKKPTSNFDLSSGVGSSFGKNGMNLYNGNLSVGTLQKKWYASGNISFIRQKFMNLPQAFDTLELEKDTKRDNSAFQNLKYGLKAGFTPQKGDEYVVSFSGIRSSKDVPVYLGVNPEVFVRYWQYPHWNKDGIYLHSRTTFTDKLILKSRWYYDTYYNMLKSFDTDQYNSQEYGYAFTSIYDDESMGGNAELKLFYWKNHKVSTGIRGKFDHHTEYNQGETPRHMKDFTGTMAMEDHWDVTPDLHVNAGIGCFFRNGIQADEYFSDQDSVGEFPIKNDQAFNYQLTATYNIWKHSSVFAGISSRSRFATMKDRYSYRIGRAIANPDLESENAMNTEIGYRLTTQEISLSTSLFYNFISNTIQQVTGVQGDLWQLQNTGESVFRGFEVSVNWQMNQLLSIGTNYSYIDQQNTSNPELHFIDVPNHDVRLFVQCERQEKFSFILSGNYQSERYSTSDGVYSVPDFFTLDLSGRYNLFDGFMVKAGIKNITDKLYYLAEGYPEAGRRYYLGMLYNFNGRK